MATWQKRWNSPQEYIKETLTTWGLFDLKKNQFTNVEFCPFIHPDLMGTTVYGAELGWTDPKLAVMKVNLWCHRCDQQTREFVRDIKLLKESGEKIKKPDLYDAALDRINSFRDQKGGCTTGCLWWDFYQAKRDNAYKKFEVTNERNLDKEIDSL